MLLVKRYDKSYFFSKMIDLKDLQFNYSKEEVDSYLKENNVTIEELLDTLIHSVKNNSRRL